MKRQLTSILLFSALLVGGASTFVSCTDNESDSNYNTSVSLADAIKKQVDELGKINTWLGELKTSNPDLAAAIDARIQANQAVIEGMAKKAILGQYADLDAAIKASQSYGELDTKIGDIESLRQKDSLAFAKADSIMKADIDSLVKRVGNVETEVEAQKILNAKYDSVFDALINKKIDQIAINASENPVTGYWNAAFLGSQLNLASSFYGVAAQSSKTFDVEANTVLGKEGNAGYIYVSLNPTEVNPALVKSIKLVDSQGNEAKGFKLGNLENTNKVLTYGYTRTLETSANGFYQIPVIAEDPQNDGVSLEKGELAEAAKEILAELKNPKNNNMNLTKVAKALYDNAKVLNSLKAYTVKIEYDLLQYNSTEKTLTPVTKHAVAPTYNMAAFAVKPLSFNFLKDNAKLDKLSDWAVENFQLPSLSSKLNKVINAIKVDLPSSTSKVEVATVLAATDVTVKAENGKVNFYKNGQTTPVASYDDATAVVEKVGEVQVDATHTQYIYKITSKVDAVSTVLADLQNSINGQLEPIKNNISKIDSKWEDIRAKVNPLLEKVASKIGSANKLLQPTIIYTDKNGKPHPLSTLGGRLGTRFVGTGATTLYATSWTAETLAPAYLKSVYVVEDGAEITLADGKTPAKTPFKGNKLIFNATKTGTYTVVYKAIDYSGVEVEKTFSVVVK